MYVVARGNSLKFVACLSVSVYLSMLIYLSMFTCLSMLIQLAMLIQLSMLIQYLCLSSYLCLSVCLPLYVSISLLVCLYLYLSISLYIYLLIRTSVRMSIQHPRMSFSDESPKPQESETARRPYNSHNKAVEKASCPNKKLALSLPWRNLTLAHPRFPAKTKKKK